MMAVISVCLHVLAGCRRGASKQSSAVAVRQPYSYIWVLPAENPLGLANSRSQPNDLARGKWAFSAETGGKTLRAIGGSRRLSACGFAPRFFHVYSGTCAKTSLRMAAPTTKPRQGVAGRSATTRGIYATRLNVPPQFSPCTHPC